MDKARVVIFDEKGKKEEQAKALRELLYLNDLKRIDEILVQQYVIRRFKSRHRVDYDTLISVRNKLGDVLRNAGMETAPDMKYEVSCSEMLECCMNFAWHRDNLVIIESGERSVIHEKLRKHVEEFADKSRRFPVIGEGNAPALVDIFVEFGSDLADIFRRFNYFYYYSPFGMTGEISGQKFYEQYFYASIGIDAISLGNRQYFENLNCDDCAESSKKPNEESQKLANLDKHSWWLYTTESEEDDDFAALIKTACYQPVKSTNIQIFHENQRQPSIGGSLSRDQLVLAVPIDDFPDNLDAALADFRRILTHELITRVVRSDSNSRRIDEFYNSTFYNTLSHKTCLIRNISEIPGVFIGLWAYDLVQAGVTTEMAPERIVTDMKALKAKYHETRGIHPYAAKTIKNSYDNVVKQIGPITRRRYASSTPRSIDKFLTRSDDVVLGEIV